MQRNFTLFWSIVSSVLYFSITLFKPNERTFNTYTWLIWGTLLRIYFELVYLHSCVLDDNAFLSGFRHHPMFESILFLLMSRKGWQTTKGSIWKPKVFSFFHECSEVKTWGFCTSASACLCLCQCMKISASAKTIFANIYLVNEILLQFTDSICISSLP